MIDLTLCLFFVVWGLGNLSWRKFSCTIPSERLLSISVAASSILINDAAPSGESLAAMNVSNLIFLMK